MIVYVMIYLGKCEFKIYKICVKFYIYILLMNKNMNNMNLDKFEVCLLNINF